jgi:hypothetical protein
VPILSVLVTACGHSASPPVSAIQQRQAELDRIADGCGAPRTNWKLLYEDHLTLQPAAYASNSTSCLISELGKSKIPVKLGFVAEPPPETPK